MRTKLMLAAVIAVAGAILAVQLFVPPIVGLADQGDFIRTIGRFSYGPEHHGQLEYSYIERKFIPDPHYRAPYWEQPNSEYLFVAPVVWMNAGRPLDLRLIGLVHLVCFLAALARLLWVARRHCAYWLLWIGALVVVTDAGYAVYWNSFYQEAASCIFLLLLLAEAIELARTGEASPAAMLRWSLWAVLWVFAKPQNAPIGLVLGLFTIRLAWRAPWRARLIAAAGTCLLFACAVYSVAAMPKVGRMANTYGMIFSGILPESKDPAADLRALGFDPALAKFSGTGAWSPVTDFQPLAIAGDLSRVSTFTILRFYVMRPARLWRRLHGVLPRISLLRPPYGNYEPSAGHPPLAISYSFSHWTWVHERVLPWFNKWIVFALIAWPVWLVWRWFRCRDAMERRRIEMLVLLPVCCLGALFGSVFGDAFDLVKHLYLYNLLLDISILYGAATLWKRVMR